MWQLFPRKRPFLLTFSNFLFSLTKLQKIHPPKKLLALILNLMESASSHLKWIIAMGFHGFIKEKLYQFVTCAKDLEWGCSGIQVPCLAPASERTVLFFTSLHLPKKIGGTELRKGYTLEAKR